MTDRQFMIQFLSVMGLLVVIAIAVFLLARIIPSGEPPDTSDPILRDVMDQRIAPVGKVYVGEVPAEAMQEAAQTGDAGAAGAGAAFADGEEVYQAVCSACHGTGAAGAPKLGDKAAWDKYLSKSIEESYQIAIDGNGPMPAKGGRTDLSDEQVKSAVDHMLKAVQ